MRLGSKQKLILTLIGIAVFPFIALIVTNRLQYVDLAKAFSRAWNQTVNLDTVLNVSRYLGLSIVTLVSILVSSAFLFEVRPDSVSIHDVWNKWYWKLFRHIILDRRYWQVLLGYFISILMINALVAEQLPQFQDKKLNLYQSIVVTIPLIATMLLSARILSKLDLVIIDTNIGVFVVVVYVSQMIFDTIALGYIPFEQLLLLFLYRPVDAELGFQIYGSQLIGATVATFVDWIIIAKMMKKRP